LQQNEGKFIQVDLKGELHRLCSLHTMIWTNFSIEIVVDEDKWNN